ncbi:hypothetical protein PRIC2_011998 [Phytophthora ramorum]
MTDNQLLLRDIDGFLSQDIPATHDSGLNLDELDGQRLLADMDALLLPLQSATSASANAGKANKTNRDIAREKAGQRRDAYRRRLKVEWAILRQQDVELSERLSNLKKRKNREKTQTRPRDSLAVGAWRAIAMKQYERREEAEDVQNRLRAAVNSRAAMIKDFQSILNKRLREADKVVEAVSDALGEKKARTKAKDATLYKTYAESLNTLYENVDEIFAEVGTNTTPGMILGGEPTRKLNGATECFENIGVGKIPFDFRRTSDAVLELSCAPHRQNERHEYDGLPDSENSKAVQFCSFLERGNGEVFTLKTYQVARRYIEKSRHVIVWRSLSEADEEFSGLNLDETGWCVVHAPTNDAEFASTLVQACIRLTPMHFEESGEKVKEKLGQFMDLSVKTVAEDNQEIERMMERLLLDDVFATDSLEIDEEGNLTSITF